MMLKNDYRPLDSIIYGAHGNLLVGRYNEIGSCRGLFEARTRGNADEIKEGDQMVAFYFAFKAFLPVS
jgi:hypothetical protein